MPQLRERCPNSLPHLREQELPVGGIRARQQQQLGFCRQQLGGRLAPVTHVAKHRAAVRLFTEREQRVAVIPSGA